MRQAASGRFLPAVPSITEDGTDYLYRVESGRWSEPGLICQGHALKCLVIDEVKLRRVYVVAYFDPPAEFA